MKIINKIKIIRGAVIDALPICVSRGIINRFRFRKSYYERLQQLRIEKIQTSGGATILFIASSLSMWRYEELINVLKNDARFNVHIILYPFVTYSIDSQRQSIDQLESYFNSESIIYVNGFLHNFDIENYVKNIDPDILFYQMPYDGVYNNYLEYDNHLDKLICYTHYGMSTIGGGRGNNSKFHNLAWRIYLRTKIHQQIAIKETYNKGCNTVVVGENNHDKIRDKKSFYEWRNLNSCTKKIIWAPHWSVLPGHALYRDSFLWLSEFMLQVADSYRGKIEIVFKPHPNLKSLLYQHPQWGKQKTNAYFEAWRKGKYTNVEEGDYKSLFATSDALIHDSGSFVAEYLFTENPVLFTCKSKGAIRKEHNKFGKMCYDLHYFASTTNEIKQFINGVLLKGIDPLKKKRQKFYNNILKIDDGLNVGMRIYNDIVKNLELE